MPHKNARILMLSGLLLSVFIMALQQVSNLDALMHLSMGKLFYTLKYFPAKEPFCYPNFHMPFVYTSWLYALLQFVTFKIANGVGLSILNACVVTLIAYVLYRDAELMTSMNPLSLCVLFAGCLLAAERFVIRPEVYAYLFVATSTYLLGGLVFENRRRLLWLIPVVHLLWGNVHSSVTLMFLPFGAFLTYLLWLVLRHRNDEDRAQFETARKQFGLVLLLLLASFAAALINPMFMKEFFYAPSAMKKGSWYLRNTVELRPPTKDLLLVLWSVFALNLALTGAALRQRALPYLLISAGMLYLAQGSVRFFGLFMLMHAPIMARSCALLLGKRLPQRGAIVGAALVSLLMITLASTKAAGVYPFKRDVLSPVKFGAGMALQVDHGQAIRYLSQNGITGRVFNILEDGQSVIWAGWPQFTVFMDGRGEIPQEMLEASTEAYASNEIMNSLHAKFGFDIVLVQRQLGTEYNAHGYATKGFEHPGWALVYVDDKTYIYLPRNDKYRDFIGSHQYRSITSSASFLQYTEVINENLPYRASLINELLRALEISESRANRLLLGYAYYADGQLEKALTNLQMAGDVSRFVDLYKGRTLIGLARYDEALRVLRERNLAKSNQEYSISIAEALALKGQPLEAAKILEEVVQRLPRKELLYKLTQYYTAAGMPEKGKAYFDQAAGEAKSGGSVVVNFNEGVRLMAAGNARAAREKFEKVIQADPANGAALGNIGYSYLDENEPGKAEQYFLRALAINANDDVALYGLGTVYRQTGNRAKAIASFEKYVQLKKEGTFYINAKKALAELKNAP